MNRPGRKPKIVYLPLDERPCNYEFPYLLAKDSAVSLVRPPLPLMGRKKQPGDTDGLWAWLEAECADAYGAIVSLDTLLYGGIVPSRLHSLDAEACEARIRRLRELKRSHPRLKLFAVHLIMRCPQYSIADEEPDYYADWGRELFLSGYLRHRQELGLASEEEAAELARIEAALPEEVRDDYLGRRAVNAEANKAAVASAAAGVIDFLVIPQDDSAPYGWTAKDQELVREEIARCDAELRTLMYPGADEAGCTLLARMLNELHGRAPLVYPRLSSANGPYFTPIYEDRPFFESLKAHILAAGGHTAASAEEADLLLLVNTPGGAMKEAVTQRYPYADDQVLRSLVELVEYGAFALERYGKPIGVADVAYGNGGDLLLLKLLRQKGLLFRLGGYAGWNTSANSLGTVLAQLMLFSIYGPTQGHLDFLALRYVEDFGYCSSVRRAIANGPIRELGLDYFAVDGQRGKAAELVREALTRFANEHINHKSEYRVAITDCYMPWSRMFETGLEVKAVRNRD
ncbi:DUF4127 family protein [Cohnella lubricantis]|uniref:DUF4127 family protein n=2 Tax=Cohnella lubricantis TaxID=2163172 RepID=A0A841TE21_9BACL|nr:DUF4127 family protein [Cohnella lubricantis]MBB6678486.1 DUF4127 family protein [Cohnella lubricantis]